MRRISRNIDRATAIRVMRRDNYTCQICKKWLPDEDIELDHKIPWSKGGVTEESNLQVTCFVCNRKKSAEFYP
jgi:5-methylcytosine-specific restriction endonuclease McrA